jgi:hypothetical protein
VDLFWCVRKIRVKPEWLQSLDLEHYARAFADNDLDPEFAASVSDEDLKSSLYPQCTSARNCPRQYRYRANKPLPHLQVLHNV